MSTDRHASSGHQLRAGTVLQETVSHVMLAGVLLSSGLGFVGGLLFLVADLVLAIVLSMAMHRDQSLWRHLAGLAATALLLLALLGFGLATYALAVTGSEFDELVSAPSHILAFDAQALQGSIALAGAHLLLLYGYAKTRPDPRRSWDLLTAYNGGTTFLTLLLLPLIVGFVLAPIVGLAQWLAPLSAVESIATVTLVAVRWILALLLLLLPEEHWLWKGPRQQDVPSAS